MYDAFFYYILARGPEVWLSELEKQVLQGTEGIKAIALLFHQQDMKTQAQDERQIVPYVGQD